MDPLWPLYLDEREGEPPVGKRSEGLLARLFGRMNRDCQVAAEIGCGTNNPSEIRHAPLAGSVICASNENITSINYGNLFALHMLVPTKLP